MTVTAKTRERKTLENLRQRVKENRNLWLEFHGDRDAIAERYKLRIEPHLLQPYLALRKHTPMYPLGVYNGDHQAQALIFLAGSLDLDACVGAGKQAVRQRAEWILTGMDVRIEKWMKENWTHVQVEFVEARNALKHFIEALKKDPRV